MKPWMVTILLALSLGISAPVSLSDELPISGKTDAPKGIILNLDFQNVHDGLIPNKTLYPLYVPLNHLDTKVIDDRTLLMFNKGQGLDIPHSSLLDPDGTIWVASIRMIALTDGIIMSQCNTDSGYVIYLKGGIVHASILTAGSVITLREGLESGIGNVIKKRVSIVLEIGPNSASLMLNRRGVSSTLLQHPLAGKNHRIHIGEHAEEPAVLKQNPISPISGFTGGISSFKILRQ